MGCRHQPPLEEPHLCNRHSLGHRLMSLEENEAASIARARRSRPRTKAHLLLYIAWLPQLWTYSASGWQLQAQAPTWVWNFTFGYSSGVYGNWQRLDNGGDGDIWTSLSMFPDGTPLSIMPTGIQLVTLPQRCADIRATMPVSQESITVGWVSVLPPRLRASPEAMRAFRHPLR
jgi:hypothetical protein